MREIDVWLDGLTQDALDVRRVADHVTVGDFQPCRATVRDARLPSGESLENYRKPLVAFDSRAQTIAIWPLKTRPSANFLRPKYYGVSQIIVEVEGLEEPETEEAATAILEEFLPQGFVKEWRWGLGVHKLYKPILDAVSQVHDPDELMPTSRTLRVTRTDPTAIRGRTYSLHHAEYDRLRATLYAVQTRHQRDALAQRSAMAFNSLLADRDPQTYGRKTPPYRADTVLKVIDNLQGVRLSPKDRSALLAEAGRRAPEAAAATPAELTELRTTLDLAALDLVISKFRVLLGKPSSEQDWQTLLSRHPFVLGMVFGHPVVLVGEQAAIGGMGLDGKGERYVDFLLKTEATNTAAIVELKRANTPLVRDTDYAGVPHIHADLLSGVMQILDQRVGFLTHLHAKRGESGQAIEGWHVSCVVIAGVRPQDPLKAKAFELYRNSLRDVVILTFDELLSRLESLRAFLATPVEPGPADPPAREPLF